MNASATNQNNISTEAYLPKSQWINWCRMCAKVENENNVNILQQNEEDHRECDSKKLSIQEALDKFFGVQTSLEDPLPKTLCSDCLSLVSFLINFKECVERVQLMYDYMNDFYSIATNNSFDLDSVHLNYRDKEQARDQTFSEYSSSEEHFLNNASKVLDTPATTKFSVADKQLQVQINLENGVEIELVDDENHEEEDFISDTEREKTFCDNSNDYYQGNNEGPSDSNEKEIEKTHNNSLSCEEDKHTEDSQTYSQVPNVLKPERNTIKSFFMNDLKINITCKECNENFTNYFPYRDHMQQKHKRQKNNKTWLCPLCPKIYISPRNLKRHIKTIHLQMIKCPECDKYYKSQDIEEHIRYKHKKEKRFICEECGLGLMNSANLRKHMLRHTDVRPFECEICQQTFKNEERVKRHMEVHSSKRYKCNICGLYLKSKATFKLHSLVHSNKWQYQCEYCSKAFKRAKAYKHHLLLHVGLRPYSCDFCERAFSTAWNCKTHVKKAHPNEYAARKSLGDKIITNNMPKVETLKAITINLKNKTST